MDSEFFAFVRPANFKRKNFGPERAVILCGILLQPLQSNGKKAGLRHRFSSYSSLT
jgi:hypothetical protein